MLKDSDYKLILTNFPDGILILNDKGKIVYSNKLIESFPGFEKENISDKKFIDLLSSPEEKNLVKDIFSDSDSHYRFPFSLQMDLKTKANKTTKYDIRFNKFSASTKNEIYYCCVISPRKQDDAILKQLASYEKKIYDIGTLIPDFISEIDCNHKFIYISDSIFGMLGYTPADLIGRQATSIIKSGEAKKVKLFFKEIFKNARPFQGYITEVKHTSGKSVFIETSGIPVTDDSGKVIAFRAVSSETGQSELNDFDFKLSEKKMEMLCKGSIRLAGIISEGDNFFVTSNIKNILGYDTESFYSITDFFNKITTGKNGENIPGKLFKWAASDSSFLEFVFDAMTESGEKKKFLMLNIKPPREIKKIVFEALLLDIGTEPDDSALQDSVLHFIERLPLDISIADASGNIIFTKSKDNIRIYRTDEKKVQENTLWKNFVNRDIIKGIIKTVEQKGFYEGDILTYSESGNKIWEQYTIFSIRDKSGKTTNYIRIKREVTKRIIEQNNSIRNNLRVFQKDKVLKILFNNLSCDFLSPMNSIIGYSEIIKENLRTSGYKYMADQIISECQTLLTNLKSLVTLIKLDYLYADIPFTKINLISSISGVIENYRNIAASENLNFIYEPKVRSASVIANKEVIGLLLTCVLDYSLHYTKKGYIKFSIDTFKKKQQEYIMLCITDSGIGIPDEDVELINSGFGENLATLPDKFNGLKMNIHFAKNICYLLHGSLTITNIKLKGTSYSIILPASVKTK
jgi:PAS domain S-box-containing protein